MNYYVYATIFVGMNIELAFQVFISGVIFGLIFFQSALTAPTVFKNLKKDQASIFLRKIFPKLFLTISFFALLSFVLSFSISKSVQNTSLIVFLISFILPLICYAIIPMTNRATDEGDLSKFKFLHTISVSLTLIVFFVNLISIFYI